MNLVLAVLRKVVRNRHAAARADRQAFDVDVLRDIGTNAKTVFPGDVGARPTASRLIVCAADR